MKEVEYFRPPKICDDIESLIIFLSKPAGFFEVVFHLYPASKVIPSSFKALLVHGIFQSCQPAHFRAVILIWVHSSQAKQCCPELQSFQK